MGYTSGGYSAGFGTAAGVQSPLDSRHAPSVVMPPQSNDSLVRNARAAKGYAGFMMGFGAAAGAVGVYAQVLAGKDQLKSQAMSLEHQQFMANLNARSAEDAAQNILAAGRREIARYTMQAGQEKSGKKVSGAARGVVLNKGSMLDILVTEDIVKEVDMMTINMNTVADAGRARVQATNIRNEGLMRGVSAGNMRRQASSMNYNAALSSVASAGNTVGQYAVAAGAFG